MSGLWWLHPPAKRRSNWAPIVWCVVWLDANERSLGNCGHRHPTRDEAMACPWEPAPVPPIGAGIVTWIRDPEYRAPGQVLREARRPREQLELQWGPG